jgi:hypothetical protein
MHEVDESWLPCLANCPQEEGDLERVAGLTEAVELIHGRER